MGFRIGQHPVAHGKIAGIGVNRQGKLEGASLRYRRQAAAVNRRNTARDKGGIIGLKLIFKKVRPAEFRQRYRGSSNGGVGPRCVRKCALVPVNTIFPEKI
jgi:hypothetical protein